MAATARVERRLAAILAADMVGYSRLVEADEAGTLAALRELAQRGDRPAAGRAPGAHRQADGRRRPRRVRLAWSTRSRCAVAIQRAMAERQAGVPSRAPDRVPHRHQPGRRGGRGRRRPARRRGERRRAPGAAVRAGRRAGLGHRLRPPGGQARLRLRAPRRAAAQEHRAAGAGVPGRSSERRDRAAAHHGAGTARAAVASRCCRSRT